MNNETRLRRLLYLCQGRVEPSNEFYARPVYSPMSEWNIKIGSQAEPYSRVTTEKIKMIKLVMPEDKLDSLASLVANNDHLRDEVSNLTFENLSLKETINEERRIRNKHKSADQAYEKYVAELEKYKILEILKK